MKMLGNFTCSLLPHQKQLLYHSCVVSLAIYSFCMWYYSGACISTKLQTL
ncbi:hypothetical protein AN958_11648 [Leucoagaricus sp. SymC.cos]|nr:hypothetical protein AN958_11648 [Leucoagaricus sp. SymC.cos]